MNNKYINSKDNKDNLYKLYFYYNEFVNWKEDIIYINKLNDFCCWLFMLIVIWVVFV